MPKFKPKDLIAALAIIGFLLLRWHKADQGFDAPFAVILGYYFVKRESGADQGH